MFEDYREKAVLGVRAFQIICAAFFVTGFIWATSDWLLVTILVEAPVTPLSVLLMLYSTIGLVGSELTVRIMRRSSNRKKA